MEKLKLISIIMYISWFRMYTFLIVIYYISSMAMVVIILLLYISRVEIWPTPDKPLRTIVFMALVNSWLFINLLLAIYLGMVRPIEIMFTGFIWVAASIISILTGLVISIWAWINFKSIKRILGLRIDNLIISGPYRYVRHPQYLSILLITLGLAILFNSLYLLIYAVSASASFILLGLMEERKLEELFSHKYLLYKKSTPLLIPLIKIRKSK